MGHDKTRFLMAILIAVSLFLALLVVSLYTSFKKTESQFNERKAVLIKENLDLKDSNKSLEETLNQRKEAFALLEQERKALEERLKSFEEEKTSLKKDYEEELLSLKRQNAFLTSKIETLEQKTLQEHIQEAMQKEENENLKRFLTKVIYNMEIIKKGGNIELEPIVVTEGKEKTKEAAIKETPIETLPVPEEKKTGKVMSVDEKYSLIVFDMGRKDGIAKASSVLS